MPTPKPEKKRRFSVKEWSWIMYDWANSVYATNIMAAIFPTIFVSVAGEAGDIWWGYATSIATFVLALLAPVLGAVADYKGMKKKLFTGFMLAGVTFTALIAATDNWKVMLIGYIVSRIGFSGSNLFYDSFLTDVTDNDRMDKVSSWGYAMGYIGGSTIPFVLSIVMLLALGYASPVAQKFSILITSVWWLVFSIPFLKNVRQTHYIERTGENSVRQTFRNIGRTAREIFQREGDTRRLDANTRQALSVALVDTAENSDANQGVRVYGFIPQANTVCLLVNHPAPEEPRLETQAAMIASFFSCYDAQCYIAQSGEAAGGLSGLDRLYAQAMAVLAGRLYDLRPGPVQLEPVCGGSSVPDMLLKRLESVAAAGSDAELLRQLDVLIAALEQASPVAAQICLQKALTILRGFLLSRRPGQALPPALLEPAAYLWKLSELPPLLQEALGVPEDADAPGDDAAFMQAVNAYIAQHLNEDISLEAISEALHFNPKYFSRKFKKVSGSTISAFLTVCRMEAASNLLRKTDLSLEVIAERTGYKTTQYFGRKFKETYGVTPGEYRRAAGGYTEIHFQKTNKDPSAQGDNPA